MRQLDPSSITLRRVEDPASAEEFLRWLGERRPTLALDTETTGLEWWTPNFVRLVQFGDGQGGWAIPFRNWRGVVEIALRRLAESGQELVLHNAGFDMHALSTEGLPLPAWHNLHDTRNLHHLTDPPANHRLKAVCEVMFGPAAVAGEQLLKQGMAKNGWTWATVPDDYFPYWGYGIVDTCLTALAAEELIPRVRAAGMWPAYEREMAYAAITWRMEDRGLRIDPEYTLALYDAWGIEVDQLRAVLRGQGIDNPSSGAQVAKALQLGGWDPEEFTDTGLPKTGEEVLRGVMAEFPGVLAEVAAMIVRYRRLVKWRKAYLERFLTKADPNWHVHPSINTMAARTGRSSVTGPALQTLPRGPDIRHSILPNEGEFLYAVDYDAQELRLFAHYAEEHRMIETFKAGMDPHIYTASLVYDAPYETISKKDPRRDTAKNTRYARLYGAGAARIAMTASASTVASGGQPVTEGEIKAFIARLEQEFPGEAAFTKRLDVLGRTRLAETGTGYVWTWGGRYMPADPDKLYSLLNFLIQGSAADLLKHKTIALDAAGYGDWIMLPVHDELLFSVPPAAIGEVPKLVEIMEEHNEFLCPLTCEASGPFSTWGYKYVK